MSAPAAASRPLQLDALCISEEITVLDTMKKLDETGQRILFIVSDEKVLRGVVTDGDLRKHILRGGGLCLLKGQLDTTFFLSNCDILIDADFGDIYNHHKAQGNVITMVCAFKHFTVPYGVIELGEGGEIQTMREKPEMNFLTNTGVYVVEPEVIRDLEDGKKQGFTDIIDKYRAMGRRVGVYPISESSWMDMGQLEELEKMRRKLENQQ